MRKTTPPPASNWRQQWLIIAEHELADYALHCIKYGNAFLYHDELQAAWRELAQGKIDWNGLLARLDQIDYLGC